MMDDSSDSDDSSRSSFEGNDYDDSEERHDNVRSNNNRVAQIFQHNELETKNDCVLLNVRRTIREFIFPTIKFINDEALCMVKLIEENNILHILLRELNRLDDDEEKRARFWLRYRSQVGSVLTSRKTEIANGMKTVVFEGKFIKIKLTVQK